MEQKSLKIEEVVNIGKLAKLPLTQLEIDKLDLSSILSYFQKLDEVDTSGLQEKTDLSVPCLRGDFPAGGLSPEDALSGAKTTYNNLYMVEAVFAE